MNNIDMDDFHLAEIRLESCHAMHLSEVFNPRSRNRALRKARASLKMRTFDTIVCTGVSGMGFASLLAHLMAKNLVYVRKPSDVSASGRSVESSRDDLGTFIILDDLIETGGTFVKIITGLRGRFPNFSYGQFAGTYLYNQAEFVQPDQTLKYIEHLFNEEVNA